MPPARSRWFPSPAEEDRPLSQAISQSSATPRPRPTAALLAAALLAGAILALSWLRAQALAAGAPSIPTGVVFAGMLAVPVLLAPAARGALQGHPRGWTLVMGAGLGLALLAPGVLLRAGGLRGAGESLPPSLLAAWAPAVCLVGVAEEAALRAGLQPLLRRATGAAPAIVGTAAVFAVLHLPLYGLAALPLDLGVGILIGCLRERTGSVAACALAHVVADLGAWWLP